MAGFVPGKKAERCIRVPAAIPHELRARPVIDNFPVLQLHHRFSEVALQKVFPVIGTEDLSVDSAAEISTGGAGSSCSNCRIFAAGRPNPPSSRQPSV